MIITKLQGGLGNQMFQYAAGRRLALLRNTEFKIDKTLFENYPHHAYSLSPFNIIENFATKEEVESFKKYKTRDGRRWMLYNFIFKDGRKYVRETQFNFDLRILTVKKDAYLDGYWQTEKYFKDIEDIIRKEFTLKVPLSKKSQEVAEEIKNSQQAVSLHVRHGLYLTDPKFNAHHGVSPVNYYDKAIKYVAERIKNPHFFVFSDDHEWVRNNIRPPFPITYIEHTSAKTDYEDITLMSMCKHHILANSTFSWWGAWLNPSPEKIVVGPEKWFQVTRYNTSDVLPESWIRL